MGFRNPVPTAAGTLDTGGTGQRVEITATGGREGGGAVLLHPNFGTAPGRMEAGSDTVGPLITLDSPPNVDGLASSLTLTGVDAVNAVGAYLSSPGGVVLDVPYVQVPAPSAGQHAASRAYVDGRTRERDYLCQAWQSTAQDCTSGEWTPMLLQGEDYDLGGFHSTTTQTSRFTAPVYGIYEFSAVIHFAANDTGRRGVRYNYAPTATATPIIARNSVAAFVAARSVTAVPGLPMLFTMEAGGWIEAQGLQDSGVTLQTFVGSDSATTAAIKLVRAL